MGLPMPRALDLNSGDLTGVMRKIAGHAKIRGREYVLVLEFDRYYGQRKVKCIVCAVPEAFKEDDEPPIHKKRIWRDRVA